jgi:hypothetical protein
MNVIMPTAMVTMHQDAEMSANSAKTAERGVRMLRALKDLPEVRENAQAILTVATNSSVEGGVNDDPELVQVGS